MSNRIEKRGSASLAIKAGFWYVISNFLVKGLSFITTPIFARLMSAADYGEFSNYASWQATLLIITGAELHNTLARAYYDFKEDYDRYVSSVTIAGCGITAVFYLLFLLCRGFIFDIVAIPEQYVHIMFVTLMFQACKQIYMARERTLYRYKSVAAISVISLVVSTLVAVVLVVLAEEAYRLDARVYGTYIPFIMVGLFCAAAILLKGRAFKWEHCKYALALSLPLLVHYLAAYLLTSSNTIVTKSVLGAEAAAVISIASSAIHIVTILLQALSGALTTWLMDNLEQKNTPTVRKGLLLYVGGISAFAVAVMLLAPEVIWVLGGSKYASAAVLMPGLVAAVLIQSITTLFTIILTYQKKVVKTAIFTTIVTGISVAAQILLLPVLGVQVLPFINLASFAVLYLINYLLVRKAGFAHVINMKGFTGIILVVAVVTAACYALYENTLARYAVIGVMALVALGGVLKYRHLLLSLVSAKFKKKRP